MGKDDTKRTFAIKRNALRAIRNSNTIKSRLMKEKEQYIEPELTVVRFKVERGFDGSPTQALIYSQFMEIYSTKSTWGTENNRFFD